MPSITDIANLALLKLGAKTILQLTDDTAGARAMNRLFEPVRDAELRRNRWKFAIKRDALVAEVAAPAWGYAYQYPLPADYLRLVQIGELYVPARGTPAAWSIEAGRVLTNMAAPLKVRYVYRNTDASTYDPLFVEALAAKLAMEACEQLTQSASKFQQVSEQYKYAISEAMSTDAMENPPDALPGGTWLESREGEVDWRDRDADGSIGTFGIGTVPS